MLDHPIEGPLSFRVEMEVFLGEPHFLNPRKPRLLLGLLWTFFLVLNKEILSHRLRSETLLQSRFRVVNFVELQRHRFFVVELHLLEPGPVFLFHVKKQSRAVGRAWVVLGTVLPVLLGLEVSIADLGQVAAMDASDIDLIREAILNLFQNLLLLKLVR